MSNADRPRNEVAERWVGDTSRAIVTSPVVTDAIARGLAVIVLVGHPDSGASSIASKPYTDPQEIGMLLLQASQFFMKAGASEDPSAPTSPFDSCSCGKAKGGNCPECNRSGKPFSPATLAGPPVPVTDPEG